MACSWVVDGGCGLPIWAIAANILNNQLQTADKGWLCRGLTTPHHKEPAYYEILHRASDLDRIFGTT